MREAMEVMWQDLWLEVGWGRLAGKTCITGGSSGATLKMVGLHGWLDNANTFDTLAPLLPAGVELLVLDLPGHGYSDHLPLGAHNTLFVYVINVYMALHKYGWDKFVLLGHSMGATVSVYYAAHFPEQVLALISLDLIRPLINFRDIHVWRRQALRQLKVDQQNQQQAPVYTEEQAIDRLIASRRNMYGINVTDNIGKDDAYILLTRSTRQVEGGYVWRHDPKTHVTQNHFFSGETFLVAVSAIRCPVLLVRAFSGFFPPHINCDQVLNAYRDNAKWFDEQMVEGNHHVHLSHPERVEPAVSRFIRKVVDSEPQLPRAKL